MLASAALLLPSGLLIALPAYAEEAPAEAGIGEPAFEEAVPDPETGLFPGQAAPADDFGPGSPGWITGFTEQEGKAPAAAPAAPKPATVAPASAPVTKPHVRRTAERTHAHTTTVRSKSTSAATGATPPTALPFTGSRLEAQLAVGAAALLGGVLLLLMGRPRHLGSPLRAARI